MSFGAGQEMAKSVKANLALKGRRKTLFDRDVIASQPTNYDFDDKQASAEQLKAIRKRMQMARKRRFKRAMVITILGMIILLLMWILVIEL